MPDIGDTLGLNGLDLRRFEVVLARLILAGVLGAFLGYRLWRRLLPDTLPPTREIAQAQTLIAIAGALMVVVIGQSTARAFGLVGLGGFIRFRSGIKDTRDAAVMFVMIGVGMACGLGAVPMAVVATLFVSVVLAMFDAGHRARLRLRKVTIDIAHPHAAWKRIQLALPGRAGDRAAGRELARVRAAGDRVGDRRDDGRLGAAHPARIETGPRDPDDQHRREQQGGLREV